MCATVTIKDSDMYVGSFVKLDGPPSQTVYAKGEAAKAEVVKIESCGIVLQNAARAIYQEIFVEQRDIIKPVLISSRCDMKVCNDAICDRTDIISYKLIQRRELQINYKNLCKYYNKIIICKYISFIFKYYISYL